MPNLSTSLDHVTSRLRWRRLVVVAGTVLLLAWGQAAAEAEAGHDDIICPPGAAHPEECYIDDTDFFRDWLAGRRAQRSGQPTRVDTQGFELVSYGLEPSGREKVYCFGDGEDGWRIQAIYVRPSNMKKATPTKLLQQRVADTAGTFEESARAHGGAVKSLRVVHDSNCRAVIETVVVTPADINNGYQAITSKLRDAGYKRTDRKYLVFVDGISGDKLCGLAGANRSTEPDPAKNINHRTTGFGLVGVECWGWAEAHEVAHTLGAVNNEAPNSTGKGHCVDEYDRMCYVDTSGKPMQYRCQPYDRWEFLFDCNGDDYFNPNPKPGSWLSKNWNMYDSYYLEYIPGEPSASATDMVGLYDPYGRITLMHDTVGGSTMPPFFYGNPGDILFSGDWDCDGVATPGLYRQSDGYVYLKNSNREGVADITFYFGNPGDIPIAGDFNGDGCDTVSVYRPSNATFYIINKLGKNGGGLGAADFSFVFGQPGDVPFVGDFDGDGVDTIGLHRPTTGRVYYRNDLSAGWAHHDFIYGRPGDMLFAGDWDGDGVDTVGVYRPGDQKVYLRNSNSAGFADYTWWVGRMMGAARFSR